MEDISLDEIREQGRLLQEKKDKLLQEKQAIEETSILKRYFEVLSEIGDIDIDIKENISEETKIRFSLCDHNLLFLETYCVRRKKYHPKFKCIDCGKRIIGAINQSQIVINEKYTEYDEGTHVGDLKDYRKLCKLYSECKEHGLGKIQTAILLEGSLYEKYQETKSILRLVRK